MSLPQPLPDTSVSVPSPQPPLRRRPRERQRPLSSATHRSLAWEMTLRTAVNVSLCGIAIAALVKLVPHYRAQRQTLQEVQTAVQAAEAETAQLRSDFAQQFDPAQSSRVLQDQQEWAAGKHIPIVWVSPEQAANVPAAGSATPKQPAVD